MRRMNLKPIDNSAVSTRQVRRQRERLAKKGRTDIGATTAYSSSKYMPHNGQQEMARRVAQALAFNDRHGDPRTPAYGVGA